MEVPAAVECSVLVIDDDENSCRSCRRILAQNGNWVEAFHDGEEALQQIRRQPPAVLILDIRMPGLDGFAVLSAVRDIDPDIVVVVITGYATIETAVDAMKAGAYDFLPKPFTPEELRRIVDRGYEHWRLLKEAQRLRCEKQEVERKFFALVSHQLKSPVAAIKQYLDVLVFTSRDQMPEKAADWVQRCQARVGELLAIIEDWLTLARLESSVLCEPDATADLAAIVRNVVSEYQQVPGGMNLSISATAPADLPLVRGNEVSIRMVVGNLVNNAVKYNRPGGLVAVQIYQTNGTVVLEVRDTGVGIPREAQQDLFKEFYRVRNSATEKIPGTGLGLVICRRVVHELGGTIAVHSQEGEGSTFTIHLPTANGADNAQEKSSERHE